MNKNLFKTFAIAAMAVLAGACAKEQVGPSDGETTEVSFNVEVPGASVATKGISDAASVDELVFQALLQHKYTDPETDKHVTEYIPVPELTKVVPVVDKKASITASLVKGQFYQFIFWAQKKGTGYYNVNTEELSNIDLRTITLDYTQVKTNDESLDAFYAVEGPTKGREFSTDVKLKRALAQINFGSEKSDRQDAKVSKASITLKNVPTTFYPLLAGTLSACGNNSEQDIVLSDNDVMSEPLSVNSVNYDYLATTYVFAPKKDQILVDASATFIFESGRTIAVKAPNAPVKQNFRTNIVGNLLLANAEWNVIINPDFQSGDIAYDAVSAGLAKGTTVTLSEDYFVADKSKGVTLDVGVTSVLNLNGKKFSNKNGYKENKAALQVHGDLTINGDGEVYCEGGADNNAIIVEQGGHLVINGGTYNVGAKSNATIFVMGPDKYGRNGSVEINGGVFMAEAGSGFVLNQHDDITVNCFSVKGGTFVGFNPASVNEANGTITSFVAEGYRAVATTYNDKPAWKVKAIPPVTTQEDFNTEIGKANSTVVLAEGTYTMPTTAADGVSIIGADASTSVLTLNSAVAWHDVNATFKNITVKYPNDNYIGIQHAESIKYTGCIIEGQPFSYANNAVFEKCTFNQTSSGSYNIWTYGSKNITFNDCVFNCAGKAVLIYNEGAISTGIATFNKCKFIASQSVTGKAAIEIDSRFTSYDVYINDCTHEGFANGSVSGNSLWNKKLGDKPVNIFVDGPQVL